MSHLLVIIDCAPSASVNQRQFTRWLDSVVAFCNSHLMLDEKNELTVIASFTTANKTILATNEGIKPSRQIISQNGQFEKFAFVTDILREGIIKLTKAGRTTSAGQTTAPAPNDCLLAGAIGMALCKINMTKMPSRILVVSCSMQVSSYASQYMNLMNSFFASQKMGIPIDGCVYIKDDTKQSSVLEQGCDLTGGQFLNILDLSGNLEYLLWIFLPSTSARETLLLPERRKATYKAACFCHRNIIDIGYVCSVCLSIFCTFNPICSSCQAHFKLDIPSEAIGKLPPSFNSKLQTNKQQTKGSSTAINNSNSHSKTTNTKPNNPIQSS